MLQYDSSPENTIFPPIDKYEDIEDKSVSEGRWHSVIGGMTVVDPGSSVGKFSLNNVMFVKND